MIRGIIVVCALLVAGWFVFDGARALVVGDYVTPTSGQYAGQLGPWAGLVQAIGIPPRSTGMKLVFVIYGLLWLGIIVGYVVRLPWAWSAMLVAGLLSLWYLPFGTVLGGVQVLLLIIRRPQRQTTQPP
ncbi:hypothetical protein GF420_03745 [candidate division GN15 bacterium]|nr:hypothetical protein [candidate division GN15 bacterium]